MKKSQTETTARIEALEARVKTLEDAAGLPSKAYSSNPQPARRKKAKLD